MPPISSLPLLLTDTVAVASSALADVAYDYHLAILQVAFLDGSIYHYLDVPAHAFEELLRADSKGSYLNRHIRGRFPHLLLRAAQ
jgi:KTSC domain